MFNDTFTIQLVSTGITDDDPNNPMDVTEYYDLEGEYVVGYETMMHNNP